MIELIFVIVILGILAAVAIPRLAATRDDAEISKAATNVSTLVNEINGYYQAQAQLPTAIEKITNIPVDGTGTTVSLKVKNKGCITFAVSNATTANPDKSIAVDDPILTLSNATAGDSEVACKGTRDAVKKLMASSPIKLGGSSVKFEE
ncbi:type II secretion system protein [Campylobacter sp.]|uniref:type II secretion system protein n=1 Tax=Campylobacter sp. TaxID=205 RepID=UPI0035A0E378